LPARPGILSVDVQEEGVIIRKRAKSHPRIKIEKIDGFSYYNPLWNRIHLTANDEDTAIRILIHELTHWSQHMFLEYQDVKKIELSYRKFTKKNVTPHHVIEKHAYFISDDILY
jgi:antirestriction protein ArdC